MSNYRNISTELKTYFRSHNLLRIMLPLDVIFIFGSLALILLNHFVGIGGLLSALAYYLFIFGLVIAVANFNHNYLYLGLFIYGGIEAYDFLRYGFFETYKYIDYFSLITCIIYIFLGYKAYKASIIYKQ